MKNLPVQIMLDTLSQAAFGRNRSECIASDTCVSCGKPKGTFIDDVSEAEYKITGLCQKCQDNFYNSIPED